MKGENGAPSIKSKRKPKIEQNIHLSGGINAMLSSRSIEYCLLLVIVLGSALFIRPARSDVTVPYEWIVPGAYARFETDYACNIFYPNYTKILFDSYPLGDSSSFLEWTVLDRTGDSVRLNVTFVAEGTGKMFWTESVSDGEIDILDIATVAIAFGKRVYEWGFDPNADVTGPGGEPDQKVNILDISFLGVAFGSSPGDPLWNPEADIAPEEKKSETGHHLHRKTLLLDIDVYSRDTFLDGKPFGKTCFWAEPYAEVDTEVMLYDLPEEIIGTVTRVSDEWASGRGWPGVTTYSVHVFELDPFAWFDYHFDWHTGMAMDINLLGDNPLNPDCTYSFNNTKITRFASTALGTELNMGTPDAYLLDLTSTNVQLGPPT